MNAVLEHEAPTIGKPPRARPNWSIVADCQARLEAAQDQVATLRARVWPSFLFGGFAGFVVGGVCGALL